MLSSHAASFDDAIDVQIRGSDADIFVSVEIRRMFAGSRVCPGTSQNSSVAISASLNLSAAYAHVLRSRWSCIIVI